ncbi:hypothetical protein LXL04_029706 [Taraxacum kok-saghyz]
MDDLPSVELHYQGTFIPEPLVYSDPKIVSITDIDLQSMSYSSFVSHIEKIIDMRCKYLYFCLPSEARLSQGLQALQNECDFSEFVEAATGSKVNVYVNHDDEPIFEWIALELPEEDEAEDQDDEEDEEVIPDGERDHEEDEEVPSVRRTVNDHFLNKLCPVQNNFEEGDEALPNYPRHDETQAWIKMEPELGMHFSSPSELKACLSNYAVANGYDLWYDRNDKHRLLVKCCKGKTPQCPFRLWASWMKEERTFQIKSLKKEHSCSRAFKLGSIVTYKWIGKQFVNEILERPRMSLRKMKAQVSKKFNINVSVGMQRYAVDLEKRECGCRSWQLSGIPCVHGMAAISSLNLNPEDFVAECFTKAAFLRAYEYSIHPLNDSSMWQGGEDQTMVLPPRRRRMPGRPCVKRKRAQSENELSGNRSTVSRAGIRQRCRICHESGHNKARCPMKPSQPVQEEPAQEEAAQDVPEQDEVDELAQDADVPEQEEGDEPAQYEEGDDPVEEPVQEPVQPSVRLRKPSQRITKNKLEEGCASEGWKRAARRKPCRLRLGDEDLDEEDDMMDGEDMEDDDMEDGGGYIWRMIDWCCNL